MGPFGDRDFTGLSVAFLSNEYELVGCQSKKFWSEGTCAPRRSSRLLRKGSPGNKSPEMRGGISAKYSSSQGTVTGGLNLASAANLTGN